MQALLLDPDCRGEYQGAADFSGTAGRVWAPAVYTFLALELGNFGWLTVCAVIVVAAIGIHPSVASAQRFGTRQSWSTTLEEGPANR